VLRSVCAAALLANCGLCVPAKAAIVPAYDSFLLRNFSGDSPVEGKSSFSMEMTEVRYAKR
jgi:DNA mismatch repair ATPase MutS